MKKILDILFIVIPALIIILGVTRVFLKKTRGINGLTMVLAIILLFAGLVRYYIFPDRSSSGSNDPKPLPITVSKHSEAFNASLENVLAAYSKLTNDLASGDTASIGNSGRAMQSALDSFRVEELMVDTIIYQTSLQPLENARSEMKAILMDPSLEEKRASMNVFSNELFSLLSIVHYDISKIYWLECPTAFGEDKPGNWLSKTEQSMNPYGKHDCNEIKTTLNFVPVDSTKKE
jgi:hypothetical protein